MSHTPWLLVWVLSSCLLRAEYSHSSFPPITYIKKERVRATLNFMIIRKLIRALSLVFSTTERRKHVGWSLAAGITNARYHSDSDRQSMRQSHHPVSTSCHRFFIQLTVKIYQKLCILPRSNGRSSRIMPVIWTQELPTVKYEDLLIRLMTGELHSTPHGEQPCRWPILHPTP